jgi:hypothetical protein
MGMSLRILFEPLIRLEPTSSSLLEAKEELMLEPERVLGRGQYGLFRIEDGDRQLRNILATLRWGDIW